MKSALFPIVLLGASLVLPAAAQRFQQEAYLMLSATKAPKVWIADATADKITLYETERGVEAVTMDIDKPDAIWLVEPPAYATAMEAFNNRNYTEAKKMFVELRKAYEKLNELPDNHSSLSAYYELECLRLVGEFDALEKGLEGLSATERSSLTRPYHSGQLALDELWIMLEKEEWKSLKSKLKEWDGKKPNHGQRAQLAYFKGRVLEQEGEAMDAIQAYAVAYSIDASGSMMAATRAAERAMKLYLADKLVVEAIGKDGTKGGTEGAARLAEGAALASFYKENLATPGSAPQAARTLLKYLPKEEDES